MHRALNFAEAADVLSYQLLQISREKKMYVLPRHPDRFNDNNKCENYLPSVAAM